MAMGCMLAVVGWWEGEQASPGVAAMSTQSSKIDRDERHTVAQGIHNGSGRHKARNCLFLFCPDILAEVLCHATGFCRR